MLDQLRNRIQDVAAWAEQASHPGADGGDTSTRSEAGEISQLEPAAGEAEEEAAASDRPITATAEPAEGGPLDFLLLLARSGAVAGGVFTNGSGIVDLTEPGETAQVPESGLVALLSLVPSDTVLEVRTASTELRAARLGEDAFAVELTPGSERKVDDWLASLLPAREG